VAHSISVTYMYVGDDSDGYAVDTPTLPELTFHHYSYDLVT